MLANTRTIASPNIGSTHQLHARVGRTGRVSVEVQMRFALEPGTPGRHFGGADKSVLDTHLRCNSRAVLSQGDALRPIWTAVRAEVAKDVWSRFTSRGGRGSRGGCGGCSSGNRSGQCGGGGGGGGGGRRRGCGGCSRWGCYWLRG